MIPISVAVVNGLVTRYLLSGEVGFEGLSPSISALHPSELFWRQLRSAEFDVSELSLASLMVAYANGDRTWKALPIFTTRRFFHTEILVREDAGIETPKDLEGRRVGVPEFQQTAAVWSRGALLHEFGVPQESIHWFMERSDDRSHAAAAGGSLPEGLKIDRIAPGSSLASALGDGTIDAALHYVAGSNFVDRSKSQASQLHQTRKLFADPIAEGIRYYEATGIFPMNHCVVVRASLLEANPWIALNIFDAFTEAKDHALKAFGQDATMFVHLGKVSPSAARFDPIPFGFVSEKKSVSTINSYLHEQGLISQEIDLEDLFAETTLAI